MRAGRLRHRLVLQSKSESQDAYGAAIITWNTETTVWGAIEPLSGKEYLAQDTLQAPTDVRIIVRYNANIDTSWRVSHDSKYYDIKAVLNENSRDRMLTLMCTEGVSENN